MKKLGFIVTLVSVAAFAQHAEEETPAVGSPGALRAASGFSSFEEIKSVIPASGKVGDCHVVVTKINNPKMGAGVKVQVIDSRGREFVTESYENKGVDAPYRSGGSAFFSNNSHNNIFMSSEGLGRRKQDGMYTMLFVNLASGKAEGLVTEKDIVVIEKASLENLGGLLGLARSSQSKESALCGNTGSFKVKP